MWVHHFESDVIYNMDTFRISCYEHSSGTKQNNFKSWKVQKTAEAKRDGLINP